MEIQPNDLQQHSQQSQPSTLSAFLSSRARNPRFAQRKSVQRGLSQEGLILPPQQQDPEFEHHNNIKPQQDHGKLHLGRSQIHWREVIEKDKRIHEEESKMTQGQLTQKASAQRKQLNPNGGISQSSIRLFLSAARNHGLSTNTSNTLEESQKLKYEEMHVEQKLKQLLLSKNPSSSRNNSMSQTPLGTIEGDDNENIIKDIQTDKTRQLSLPPTFEGYQKLPKQQQFQLSQELPQTSRRSISPRLVSLDSFSRNYYPPQVETIQPMTQRSYSKYSLVNNNCLESPSNMQKQQQNKSITSSKAGRIRKVSEDNKSYADSKKDIPIVMLIPNSSQSAAVSPKNQRRQDITSSSSAETLYQQYINRLISARNKQRDTQLAAAVINATTATGGMHAQDNININNNNSMRFNQKQLDSSYKGTLSVLPFLEDSNCHSQSATLSGNNIIYSTTPRMSQRNIYNTNRISSTTNKDYINHQIPLLNYPASSKDLQAFSKAQEANELRFALMAGDEDQELSGISKLKNKKTLLFNSHSKSQANFSRSSNNKADSLRISELVKERNEALEIQKAERIRNQAYKGQMLNAQVEGLIEESNQNQNISQSKSNRLIDVPSTNMNIKRNKRNLSYQPLVIEVNDPSEIHKGIKLKQVNISSKNSNNNSSIIISKDKRSTTSYIMQSQETIHNNNNNNQQQQQQSQDESQTAFQIELAQQATLVNHLQQQKLGIRQLLNSYLINSQKTSKSILKNCLMDAEQFVFYMTSFYQFCIDDMFYQYKKQATQELAHKTNKSYNNNIINSTPSQIQYLSTDDSIPSFKFNQKIPSEIVMPIVDIIGDYLKGIPLVAIRDASPRRTLKSPIKIQRGDSPVLKKISEENEESPNNKRINLRLQQIQSNNPEPNRLSLLRFAQPSIICEPFEQTTSEYLSNVVTPPVELQPGIDRFIELLQSRSYQCLIPVSTMERIGGFARIRELIIEGVKLINNYINSASKMNLIEENDEQLIDKHLMPAVCALINKDNNTLMTQLTLFQSQNTLSFYDFFTIKKVFWDLMSNIRLDAGIKQHVILQLENLRFQVFKHPFEGRINDLAVALGKQYEICNYFRGNNSNSNNSSSNNNSNNHNNNISQENVTFLQMVFQVMYNNQPYSMLHDALAPRLKFPVNDKFFDHLTRFLLEELSETDQKSILDLTIRLQKLKLKANVIPDIFSLFNDDAGALFEQFQPFLKHWIQKYNLGNSLMDAKAMDFKFLEIFIKWGMTRQDMFSVADTEPALMHFVVNEFTISLWVKGIAAFFESRQTDKSLYQPLIQFIEMYLLFKRNDGLEGNNGKNMNKQPTSPKKKNMKSQSKIN